MGHGGAGFDVRVGVNMDMGKPSEGFEKGAVCDV